MNATDRLLANIVRDLAQHLRMLMGSKSDPLDTPIPWKAQGTWVSAESEYTVSIFSGVEQRRASGATEYESLTNLAGVLIAEIEKIQAETERVLTRSRSVLREIDNARVLAMVSAAAAADAEEYVLRIAREAREVR